MAPRDPTADTEPNFESAEWEVMRNVLIDNGKSPDEAVDILRQGWRGQHERNVEPGTNGNYSSIRTGKVERMAIETPRTQSGDLPRVSSTYSQPSTS